ncbi:MAG: ABC transporter permease [Lachnospiraceae bacterium]|nr:ABC transporter permease [Lachnospiraceae bacterium]MDE7285345.1 ABC transporter permease [Lachnospiraceae bacterium]
MKNLIHLEIKKVSLKPHIVGVIVANFIILLLSVFTSSLLTASGNGSASTDLPTVQLDTVTLALMLVRAMLIVWEAVLISEFVIEEYRNKTINLLFTYPVNRAKLMLAKLFLICGTMFLFHMLSSIFQYVCIFFASQYFAFVTFGFGDIWIQVITAVSAILLGLFPLYVGMIKKSTIATVVSSIVIVVIASNSQGNSAGLLSIPVAAIIFGVIGVVFSTIAVNKMISSDLNN